jgi:hypothetical protein
MNDPNMLRGEDERSAVPSFGDYQVLDQNVRPADVAQMPPNGADGAPY